MARKQREAIFFSFRRHYRPPNIKLERLATQLTKEARNRPVRSKGVLAAASE